LIDNKGSALARIWNEATVWKQAVGYQPSAISKESPSTKKPAVGSPLLILIEQRETLRGCHANGSRLNWQSGSQCGGQSGEGGKVSDFAGPNPNLIDIKGDFWLGFCTEPIEASILLKKEALTYVKPLCV
jgi:hypothetical protein